MKVIGLLSTKEEVDELKYIAQICEVENRVHFIARIQKIKSLMRNEV